MEDINGNIEEMLNIDLHELIFPKGTYYQYLKEEKTEPCGEQGSTQGSQNTDNKRKYHMTILGLPPRNQGSMRVIGDVCAGSLDIKQDTLKENYPKKKLIVNRKLTSIPVREVDLSILEGKNTLILCGGREERMRTADTKVAEGLQKMINTEERTRVYLRTKEDQCSTRTSMRRGRRWTKNI